MRELEPSFQPVVNLKNLPSVMEEGKTLFEGWVGPVQVGEPQVSDYRCKIRVMTLEGTADLIFGHIPAGRKRKDFPNVILFPIRIEGDEHLGSQFLNSMRAAVEAKIERDDTED